MTKSLKEILRRSNVLESGVGCTTSVYTYPLGISPYGVMDMTGNVWEWQANYQNTKMGWLALRGGSWEGNKLGASVSVHYNVFPNGRYNSLGFRVVIIPKV